MTKEELEKRRAARDLKRLELKKRFPEGRIAACFPNRVVVIAMTEGISLIIEVHARGDWSEGSNGWRTEHLVITKDVALDELADFISALVARYNYAVRQINNAAATVQPMESPKEIV